MLGLQLVQCPRFGLRIGLFEVSEEGGVRQVLQARGVIGHDVRRSWKVEALVAVAVLALVGARLVAQECCRSVTAYSAFVESRNRWSVVIPCQDRGVRHVVVVCQDRGLGLRAGLFQVTVGDGSRGVISRHQPPLDFYWKREAPDVGRARRVIVDAPHPSLGGVSRASVGRILFHDFREVRRSFTETNG